MAEIPAPKSTNPAIQVASQLKELWGKQPKKRKTAAIAVAVGIAGIIAFTQLAKQTERWAVVAEVSPDDTQELYGTLAARDIPVRMKDGKVEVEADKLTQARAIAAAAGLPRGGKGFELFDESGLGKSSFAEQVNYVRAIEGELARSITSLAQVQSARVHLTLGKKSVFEREAEPASASVALHLHPGQTLSSEQVRGIRQLVGASVSGLKSDAVVIVDQHANLLDGAEPGSADRRGDIEQKLATRIRSMLERVVGRGKVSVVVTAVVDEAKQTETEEIYDQSKPALRSESRNFEGENAGTNTSGVAGARGNLPGNPAGAGPQPGDPGVKRLAETKNYEVNKTTRTTVKPESLLKQLHVAIVVDHKADGEGKTSPRTPDELAQLKALAGEAAGLDEKRGDKLELRSIPFAAEPDIAAVAPEGEAIPMIPAAIGGGALLAVIIGLIMFSLRKKKKAAADAAARSVSLALPAPVVELERVLEARLATEIDENGKPVDPALPAAPEPKSLPPGKQVRERVLEVVRADSERAAEVLTAWLSENTATSSTAAQQPRGKQ